MGMLLLGGAWLGGVALGYGRDARSWWAVGCWLGVALLAAAALLPRQRRALVWATLLLGVVGLATWRTGLTATTPARLPPGAISAARGVVAEWPTRGDRSDAAIVAVEAVRVGEVWIPVTARVRADVPIAPSIGRGDRLEAYGSFRPTARIEQPGFRGWLEQRGLHGHVQVYATRVLATGERASIGARHFAILGDLEVRLRRHIPGAEGALATGLLLGDHRFLPERTRDAFDATSTSHTMALSGWNITIIAGGCGWWGWLRRSRSRYWLGGSTLAIWAFVAFVGASPTLVRAAIMGTIYLLAELVGRRGDALTALVASAVAMTAHAPATILDIGFQLSCAATAGIIALAPGLAALLGRARLPRAVAIGAATTFAAEVATFPLILHHFGRLSRVTLPANLLIEPLVPPIMAGAFLTAIVGPLPGPLGALFGFLTWLPARLLLLVVETLGALPWAVQRFPAPDWPLTLALYGGLVLAIGGPRWVPWLRAIVGRGLPVDRSGLAPVAAGVVGGVAVGAWVVLLWG